jgi:hypothetical protein
MSIQLSAPMSKTVPVPKTTRDMKKYFKESGILHEHQSVIDKNGYNTEPINPEFCSQMVAISTKFIELYHQFCEECKKLEDMKVVTRKSPISPSLVDERLTDLVGSRFGCQFPTIGKYGVTDLNMITNKAITLWCKTSGLQKGSFITLPPELTNLVLSPSINDSTKSYLVLAQDSITVNRSKPGYKLTQSSAQIYVGGEGNDDRSIRLNFAALKILLPMFKIKHHLVNPDPYVEELKKIHEKISTLANKHKETEDLAKKKTRNQ